MRLQALVLIRQDGNEKILGGLFRRHSLVSYAEGRSFSCLWENRAILTWNQIALVAAPANYLLVLPTPHRCGAKRAYLGGFLFYWIV